MIKQSEHIHTISKIYDILLKDITISEKNVRLTTPEKGLDELADSIKILGLLQPVLLEGEYGKKPYKLISGQRRFLAHEQILNYRTIKAVFAGKLTETEILVRSLVENMQRTDLEFTDTSKAVTTLFRELGNEKVVKDATGLSIRRIRDHLLIEARATPKMKEQLGDGKVSPMDVKRALRAAKDNLEKAEELLDLIVEHNPSAHIKRRLVTYGNESPDAPAQEIFEKAYAPHIEQELIISLTSDLRDSLDKATNKLQMDATDLAEKVLTDWLSEQGF